MPSLIVPPPEIPVISWLTPNKTDQGLLEFWNTEIASYIPLDIGAAHPNARQYPNFRLGKQSPVQGDEKWTLRIWVTDETNPDWFNWAEKFSGEDNDFPIFIRTYRESRNSYTPRTKGTPLGTLFKLVVTDPGSGYTTGALPSVTFDNPIVAPTSVAIAHGVVSPDGTISEAVLDFGGDGYEQDVEFHVVDPINGLPASGIAYVQPQTAILVKEEASLFPEDSPFYAQYLQVARIYETLPGPIFTKTVIDQNGDIMTETRQRVEASSITTTNVINAGVWTKTFQDPTDNDFVSEQVIRVRDTQNELDSFEVSIPDLIPPEFRGVAPITTTEQTLIGDASLPVFSGWPAGRLSERQAQLDAYTYRLTISGREDISLPVTLTGQELTEQYGGGSLNVVQTLDLIGNLTLDEGLLVVSSEIKNLGNGLGVLVTSQNQAVTWPVIASRLWDENYRVEYDETRQVVAAGTSEDANPGGVFAWVSEVKGIDKWRSIIINTSKPTPDYVDESNALISYEAKPFKFPGYLVPTVFTFYVRSAYAELITHTLRTWWIVSSTTPTVGPTGDIVVEDIIPDNVIISVLNDATVLAYSGMVLHDDLITFAVFFWPATTPSYTDYLASWQGFEKVVAATVKPEKEKDVWRVTTESVTMR